MSSGLPKCGRRDLGRVEGIDMRAEPVLKWAGGKRQLLPEICARLPARIHTYFEPFLGGGAVLFELAQKRRFERAVVSDQNPELVETYQVIQRDVESLIKILSKMPHSEEEYYRVRASSPRLPSRRAARMIYLNRTGYNGLYRVNKSGQFNVPFGRYVSPRICDPERLRAAAAVLARVEIRHSDFEQTVARARPRDAVYFDPPYVPLSETARFAEYYSTPFGEAEHRRLQRVFAELVNRRVDVLLSNSDTPLTRELYGDYCLETVAARRNINSDGTRRGQVHEILVGGPLRTGLRLGATA
jgi:DNA adenine methylase